jgi:hypothetical protein
VLPSWLLAVAFTLALPWARQLLAQSEYHDLDAGQPTRIEGAQTTPRQALEWNMAPVQVEQFSGGLTRYQVEPALSYGILPRTDISITAPFIVRERGATPHQGLTGIAFSAMHNFNPESPSWPAFAVKGEVMFPAAGATTSGTLYAARAVATRTFGSVRLHLNVEVSSYNVAAPTSNGCTSSCPTNPPPIPDSPCAPGPEDPFAAGASSGPGSESTVPRAAAAAGSSSPAQTGGRLALIGMAADRTFPLLSLLLVGDVYMVGYSGAPARASDWAADVGFRRQMTPRLVLDAGLGRRFLGLRPEWLVTVGTTYTFAIRAFIPEARPGALHP